MKITVTKQDIERGWTTICPVGRAINTALRVRGTRVSGGTIYVNQHRPLIPTPRRVQQWISRFDMGLHVKPFTFTLPAAREGAGQ